MNNKILPLFIIILCFGIGFQILVFSEKGKFSVTENRKLSIVEAISVDNWLYGDFQTSIESTLADQFLARDFLVRFYNKMNFSLKGYMNVIGRQFVDVQANDKIIVTTVNESIYLMEMNGEKRLVRSPKVYTPELYAFVDEKVKLLNKFKTIYKDVEFYSYIVESPHHSKFVYPESESNELMTHLQKMAFRSKFFTINTIEELRKYFYATDHHWNHQGSYKGYIEIAELMGVQPREILKPMDLLNFSEVQFWGSHSRTIAHAIDLNPDSLSKYTFELPKYNLTIDGIPVLKYGNLDAYLKPLDEASRVQGFDHYNNIHQSRKANIQFDTNRDNLDNLLVISDSMSNPIRDLIASHYNKTRFINMDVYEYTVDKFEFEKIMKEGDYDKVLFFLSLDNFFHDGEIKYLTE